MSRWQAGSKAVVFAAACRMASTAISKSVRAWLEWARGDAVPLAATEAP